MHAIAFPASLVIPAGGSSRVLEAIVPTANALLLGLKAKEGNLKAAGQEDD